MSFRFDWYAFANTVSSLYCDDPSGVLIRSTTRYSKLYRVEPSYTEQVIRSRVFLLS